MKEMFQAVEIEVIAFDENDIICTSGEWGEGDEF